MEKTRIKLTLGQISCLNERGEPAFMLAVRKLRKLPLGKEAYAVGKSLRTIETEFADYNEAYASIVQLYGKEDGKGGWLVDAKDQTNFETANAAIRDLKAKEFEIHLDHKIKLPDVTPIADRLDQLAKQIMQNAGAAQPDQILPAAQMLAAIINEWWSLVLTPEDAMQLELLITE